MYERLKRDLSYIQGMLEGDVNHQEHIEYKAVQRLLDVTDQLVEVSEQMDRRLSELEEYVEAVDEDLNDLELLVYDDEEDLEDDEMITVTCPDCGDEVLIDAEDLEDDSIELLCPKCNTVLELEDINDDDVDEIIMEEA
ncbi:MAG: CD1247 N-terminal domain-containing protein [Thermoactinomyces sp.]